MSEQQEYGRTEIGSSCPFLIAFCGSELFHAHQPGSGVTSALLLHEAHGITVFLSAGSTHTGQVAQFPRESSAPLFGLSFTVNAW